MIWPCLWELWCWGTGTTIGRGTQGKDQPFFIESRNNTTNLVAFWALGFRDCPGLVTNFNICWYLSSFPGDMLRGVQSRLGDKKSNGSAGPELREAQPIGLRNMLGISSESSDIFGELASSAECMSSLQSYWWNSPSASSNQGSQDGGWARRGWIVSPQTGWGSCVMRWLWLNILICHCIVWDIPLYIHARVILYPIYRNCTPDIVALKGWHYLRHVSVTLACCTQLGSCVVVCGWCWTLFAPVTWWLEGTRFHHFTVWLICILEGFVENVL